MAALIPDNIATRPIAIIGAGTLGRRIGLMLCTQGAEVRLYDTRPASAQQAVDYIGGALPALLPTIANGRAGPLVATSDLPTAVEDAWLIIEAVPEIPNLKRSVLANLDKLAPGDAIIASNSSSYPSGELIADVRNVERVLTTHFYMPPRVLPVEVMASDKTDDAIVQLLMRQLPLYGVIPFQVRKESVGLIFNRVWAAIKRESLEVVAEGVTTPEELDTLFNLIVGGSFGPFRNMDQVGLDVVLAIEEHYAQTRPGLPEAPRDLLKRYVEKGRLGVKTGHGFYDDYDAPAGAGGAAS
ncbi:3-hydroxyacyl-CoA dehydrogenase family protein [Sphingomonas nostoxanthinifaciens]|uniref:3-hydroxyacyl-CoA dehydrogenase family protein n=1 Tax=Sphingomonas nostoxanthinifaciens TaxID=2872652 RepID=UPI001CC215AC|nr:3-hydroxyacyl-CoA dehydrogenase family protein [Sphingomonas nostoxanthinifaciens]UAK26282.1 3-hydroxyacyl-CoA dehydrogenase family protein [Sphingomonas nostoxanthinifaciens]